MAFVEPSGVAVGPRGRVYVSDAGLRALLAIDSAGADVQRSELPLQNVEPLLYVAVDGRGHAYVSDTAGSVVYHASPDEEKVETIGMPIQEP